MFERGHVQELLDICPHETQQSQELVFDILMLVFKANHGLASDFFSIVVDESMFHYIPLLNRLKILKSMKPVRLIVVLMLCYCEKYTKYLTSC